MCVPCGDFNRAGSEPSLPPKLSLEAKAAVVTGARSNLGFHVTLRLLRCGARVIASTRYPNDALSRYQAENDSGEWVDRLCIIGADFRAAKDAFHLVQIIRSIVSEWGGQLHILINNAAQTVTDSVDKERHAITREHVVKVSTGEVAVLPHSSYQAQIRGGNILTIESLLGASQSSDPLKVLSTSKTVGAKIEQTRSSWVQSLPDILYEDIVTAQSVNAFVPLISIRELLHMMAENSSERSSKKEANGYIVNVSSCKAKNTKYMHTNMSKATLNMITETEAAEIWKKYRSAMNTVDPGYMSAAPEFKDKFGGRRPISWDDGAGRVLWPVAVGELEKSGEQGCHAVWGRLLKHYGAVRASIR
ncbi:NAD(P)-binding protein [Xylariaceae sp. FL1272]|nr:NAD(P)-binding protein [Xylariaceae sp. FL1272]